MRGWSSLRMTFGAALAVAVLAVMAGCDTVRAPGAADPDPISDAAYPKVAALGGLGSYMSSSEPAVEGGDGERPLHVAVPVRLRSDHEVSAQYRFIFFDEDRMPVHPRADWRFTTLNPRAQVFLEATATDLEARDWRLEIRPAQ